MLNYNHLYYFHVVASEGSFANAAEKLGVTQPTISEQVKTLERTLGATLFERQPAGLRLTDEGRVAFEHTAVMFRAGARLREVVGREDSGRMLRVGISSIVGRTTSTSFFLPLLGIAGVVPSLRTQDPVELVRDLRSGELDLVVLETEPSTAMRSSLEIARLDAITLDAVASPKTAPSREWANLGFVHYRASSPFRASIDAYLEANTLRPKFVGEAEDALFLLDAAAREGYVAFVPRTVAHAAIESGQLARIASIEGAATLFALHACTDLAREAAALLTSA
jgi:LysR family transcriptional activator of nhaA